MNKPAHPLTVETIAPSPVPTTHERHSMIEVAAYFLYERNGFDPDRALEHWLQAEAQIDDELARSADQAHPARPAETDTQPATAEPKAAKLSAAETTQAKPAEAKPAAAKPATAKAAAAKSARAKSAGIQSATATKAAPAKTVTKAAAKSAGKRGAKPGA